MYAWLVHTLNRNLSIIQKFCVCTDISIPTQITSAAFLINICYWVTWPSERFPAHGRGSRNWMISRSLPTQIILGFYGSIILYNVWFFKNTQDLPNYFQLSALCSWNNLNFQSVLLKQQALNSSENVHNTEIDQFAEDDLEGAYKITCKDKCFLVSSILKHKLPPHSTKNALPAITVKSASTSQAITSPFFMCFFTASFTLPIPNSFPPSPTPL